MKTSQCCTCGFEWLTGMDGSHSCSTKLREDLDKARSGKWYSACVRISQILIAAGRPEQDLPDAVQSLVDELNEANTELASVYATSESEALADTTANAFKLMELLEAEKANTAECHSALHLYLEWHKQVCSSQNDTNAQFMERVHLLAGARKSAEKALSLTKPST